jgi:hypothetical protein
MRPDVFDGKYVPTQGQHMTGVLHKSSGGDIPKSVVEAIDYHPLMTVGIE